MFAHNPLLTVAVVSVLTGIVVAAVLYAIALYSNEQEARINRRVKQYIMPRNLLGRAGSTFSGTREQQRANLFAQLDGRWKGRTYFKSLQGEIQGAGINKTVTELLLIQVGTGLLLSATAWYFLQPWGLLLAPVCIWLGVFIVRYCVRFMAKRRVAKFEEQLPNTLAILASSVRGGFSLFQALHMISREADEPSKTEFTKVIQEITLGNPLNVALEGLSKRMPTEDVDILVTAITMQQQTGGNLTHVLDVVAATVRERQRVKREIKSLTAQQRFSAILLGMLPFLLAGALYLINPKYIGKLFQPGWVMCMPVGAFVFTVVGFLLMRKLADIDV